ncbi:hypothetical protein [Streptomyces sp. ITFR-16]|uniref:hypothetical protein n=1 Tax=Streptomyces sp. ITFR-16 TaxID=3075198 RepID=UPI002889465E|nr:hypothetical protein [Streptomyces sp. ITFR-16]WNI20413.1 hypothetical protein RLT58_00050 [Streptomyces sp. ITFR-16]
MRRRLAALLVALVAVFGLAVTAPQPAAADGVVGGGIELTCKYGGGLVGAAILELTDSDLCEKVGDAGQKFVNKAWKSVWEGALGDLIKSAADTARWVIKKVLTVALAGPSVDLAGTGLFGRDATLAGMLMWLGLVIAALGVTWQAGKMALTGQSKHLGRAALGWVENLVLSTIGVAIFAILLKASDALTKGLVDAVFDDAGDAYKRIVAVLIPVAVQNPATLAGVVLILLLIGFIQLVMVFLRQSAIPLICLLLPVAGAGRTGGETTRQWAPKLITSGLVILAYKPILAVIICTGFAEFGKAHTLAEWLRGCATLILGVLAPGPLTKIFAPFGDAVGAGMASGGASGALGAAASYMGNRGGGDGGEGVPPVTPVRHAQYVQQNMPRPPDNPDDPDDPDPSGPPPGPNGPRRPARRRSTVSVPGQNTPEDGVTTEGGIKVVEGSPNPSPGTTSAPGGIGLGLEILDGINDGVHHASEQFGNEGNQR